MEKDKGGKLMLYNSKAFGRVIGRLRAERGLTQDSASALAGISRSHWAALESGQKIPKLTTLFNIAYALSVSPSKLLELTEKEA